MTFLRPESSHLKYKYRQDQMRLFSLVIASEKKNNKILKVMSGCLPQNETLFLILLSKRTIKYKYIIVSLYRSNSRLVFIFICFMHFYPNIYWCIFGFFCKNQLKIKIKKWADDTLYMSCGECIIACNENDNLK